MARAATARRIGSGDPKRPDEATTGALPDQRATSGVGDVRSTEKNEIASARAGRMTRTGAMVARRATAMPRATSEAARDRPDRMIDLVILSVAAPGQPRERMEAARAGRLGRVEIDPASPEMRIGPGISRAARAHVPRVMGIARGIPSLGKDHAPATAVIGVGMRDRRADHARPSARTGAAISGVVDRDPATTARVISAATGPARRVRIAPVTPGVKDRG